MPLQTIDGITADFKQGAWYQGRQYWNGTLSQMGAINSQSDQQGAGQMVSKEVVDQTNKDNWAYLHPSTPSNGGGGSSTPNGGGGNGGGAAPTGGVNLVNDYKNLMNTPEIQAIKTSIDDVSKRLNDKQNAYNEAQALINDNPFYSESTRVGKSEKLSSNYARDVSSLQNELTGYTTKLNTLTGQASTIMDLTVKQNELNKPQTQVISSTDDAGNVTATVINSATGEIISKTNLGKIDKATKATGTGSGSIYGALVDKYLSSAEEVAKEIDLSTNPKLNEATGAYEGDKYLSKDEAALLQQRILGLVGDVTVAQQLFNRVWATGGYQKWNW